MKKVSEKEDELFDAWESESNNDGYPDFCRDGLIFNGEVFNNNHNVCSGNQEELLNNAKRRIVFFMKEPNSNPDEDYRTWALEGDSKHAFFIMIYSWLSELSKIQANDVDISPVTYTFPKNLPLIIVNAKKVSGGASADDNAVYAYAEKYRDNLRKQLDIYSPNIIVCGGGYICKTGEVLMHYIANHIIYNDIEFTKMEGSNWIWYSVEKQMVLINSYHPTSRTSYEDKYHGLIQEFKSFLKLNLFAL